MPKSLNGKTLYAFVPVGGGEVSVKVNVFSSTVPIVAQSPSA